jgi:hypothetical protein
MAFSLSRILAFTLYLSSSLINGLPATPESPGSPVGPAPHSPGGYAAVSPNAAGGYVRVSRMNDGSLVAGYATTEDSAQGTESVLKLARSTDGAKSWQPQGEVFRGLVSEHDISNSFPLELPNGRLLYAYRNHDRTGADLHYTWFRISISYSDDGGKTFLYLATVDERAPAGVNGLWEPFLRIARDGSLQCYYSSEQASNVQVGLMKVSTNGGSTWGAPITVSGGNGLISRDGMIGVAPVDNNRNLM